MYDLEQPEYLGLCAQCYAQVWRLPSGRLHVKNPEPGCLCDINEPLSEEDEESLSENNR